ncbi:MAG: universal stress protein [Proteobacteria bacterium]|nr:universal stress protein [Pseudomonadota bacterium]
MPLKSILVPMTAAPADRRALDLALALGRAGGAHIGALYPKRDPREAATYVGMGGDITGIGQIMAQIESEADAASTRARTTVERWRADAGLAEAARPGTAPHPTVGWRAPTGDPDQLVTQAAAGADLVVCAGLQPEPGAEQTLIEAALFGAARPVVTAPATLPRNLLASAVVAWNGSHEANRALAAMLTLLPAFGQVHLFCQPEGHRAVVDPVDALELLAWHRVKAQVLPAGTGDDVGAALLAAASSVEASFLAMGAYTHGRMRQMMFGGVTHHVLHHAKLPVLLVH